MHIITIIRIAIIVIKTSLTYIDRYMSSARKNGTTADPGTFRLTLCSIFGLCKTSNKKTTPELRIAIFRTKRRSKEYFFTFFLLRTKIKLLLAPTIFFLYFTFQPVRNVISLTVSVVIPPFSIPNTPWSEGELCYYEAIYINPLKAPFQTWWFLG